jgi:hypothetical protein
MSQTLTLTITPTLTLTLGPTLTLTCSPTPTLTPRRRGAPAEEQGDQDCRGALRSPDAPADPSLGHAHPERTGRVLLDGTLLNYYTTALLHY